MLSESSPSIVSGREYSVVRVRGRAGFVLDDLLGDVTVEIEADGQLHPMVGVGAAAPFGVRFYEKDPARHGSDVRIWRITRNADNSLTAVHDAAI